MLINESSMFQPSPSGKGRGKEGPLLGLTPFQEPLSPTSPGRVPIQDASLHVAEALELPSCAHLESAGRLEGSRLERCREAAACPLLPPGPPSAQGCGPLPARPQRLLPPDGAVLCRAGPFLGLSGSLCLPHLEPLRSHSGVNPKGSRTRSGARGWATQTHPPRRSVPQSGIRQVALGVHRLLPYHSLFDPGGRLRFFPAIRRPHLTAPRGPGCDPHHLLPFRFDVRLHRAFARGLLRVPSFGGACDDPPQSQREAFLFPSGQARTDHQPQAL